MAATKVSAKVTGFPNPSGVNGDLIDFLIGDGSRAMDTNVLIASRRMGSCERRPTRSRIIDGQKHIKPYTTVFQHSLNPFVHMRICIGPLAQKGSTLLIGLLRGNCVVTAGELREKSYLIVVI
jgi:hypothetical protein